MLEFDLKQLDPRIHIEKEFPSSNLKHIILPRYMEMFHILLRLSREDLTYAVRQLFGKDLEELFFDGRQLLLDYFPSKDQVHIKIFVN